MKLLEKAFQLVVHISSAQWVIGIGEDTVEVNATVGLSVDDSRVEGIAHLIACGVSLRFIKNCSDDIAHQFSHFCFIVRFVALDKTVGMHYDAIAVIRGLDELCQRFGHPEVLDV